MVALRWGSAGGEPFNTRLSERRSWQAAPEAGVTLETLHDNFCSVVDKIARGSCPLRGAWV